MRGHRLKRGAQRPARGTIPAGAGTPASPMVHLPLFGDYPRGCGDTDARRQSAVGGSGLSPRVRGHRSAGTGRGRAARTIPAGAGTPGLSHFSCRRLGDYPRGCGDTSSTMSKLPEVTGLSPRVRGHPKRELRDQLLQGTIPAGAGTPVGDRAANAAVEDYPRGCGDTLIAFGPQLWDWGLSPRVRGHRQGADQGASTWGTIPAGAGTPSTESSPKTCWRDYPRGCGDTRFSQRKSSQARGLSPRVRGHRKRRSAAPLCERTIPAGAGTPLAGDAVPVLFEDYPRGCGDTTRQFPEKNPLKGLSPRVRGHPSRSIYRHCPKRTIPAGAGTPLCHYGITAAKKGQLRID